MAHLKFTSVMIQQSSNKLRGCSILTPCLGGRWFYSSFVIFLDGKVGDGWYFIQFNRLAYGQIFAEYDINLLRLIFYIFICFCIFFFMYGNFL